MPPVLLADLRWGLAFLLILPFAWPAIRSDLVVIRRSVGILLLLSFTGISTFNTLLYWSLQYTTAINATLMQSSAPLLIGLWSLVLFREPLTRGQLGGIVISLAGIAAIVSEGDPARLLTLELNVGDIVVVIAMIFYALYSALLRKRPAMAPLSFLAVTIGIGTVLLLPLTVAEAVAGARLAPLNAGTLAALVLCRGLPLDRRLSLLQPRRPAHRPQPGRAVLPSHPAVRGAACHRLPGREAGAPSCRRRRVDRGRRRPGQSPPGRGAQEFGWRRRASAHKSAGMTTVMGARVRLT